MLRLLQPGLSTRLDMSFRYWPWWITFKDFLFATSYGGNSLNFIPCFTSKNYHPVGP